MGSNVFMRNPLWTTGLPAGRTASKSGLVLIGGLAATLAGCSADVARFDFGPNTLNDRSATASISPPSEPMAASRSNLLGSDSPVSASAPRAEGQHTEGGAYIPPASNRTSGVKMAALPSVSQPSAPAPSAALEQPRTLSDAPRAGSEAARTSFAPPPVAPVVASNEKGEQIEVQKGDTLFGLSKRHKVSVSELMTVNNLNGPALKPGQKLHLPANRAAERSAPRAVAAAAPVERPADWNGSYTVKSGDVLYTIARQNKIKLEDLQRYNGITDVRRVKPGMVLHVPSAAGIAAPVVASAAPAVADTAPVAPVASNAVSVTPPAEAVKDAVAATTPANGEPISAPRVLNAAPAAATSADKVALAPTATANDAAPIAAGAAAAAPGSGSVALSGKLRWPAQGKIISGFGQRTDGTHNDGINLAVPMGTDIHAAEEGTVAYSGSELKGYGNLILLRHDNGWVTAYAHSDELLVKRGDRVKRGQVIAKAGKSGSVDQPQVHFEVRQGQKPVDPTPFMEKI